MATNAGPFGVLLDIDGVLYVGDEPIDGAHQALARLRGLSSGLRLLTNTTSRSRRAVFEHLCELGFEVRLEEVLTPAALAVRYCEEHAYGSVALLVSDSLREDLGALGERPRAGHVDAVILGDLGSGFTAQALNDAFRLLMDGAQLIALQHNRYWRRADGLALDVGSYAAALEYACGREAVVIGKPAAAFFSSALADMALERGVMIGDDIEADVAGAIASGLFGVLVRTGKYREEALAGSPTQPTVVADSISDVPDLLPGLFAA
ncbi:MAG TPA: TIGR01458 family HAD-type hydrolase [Solirubrobacteraceae bacterium]|jgi:HAD superfamily hydrolase (TIGR01458 family)